MIIIKWATISIFILLTVVGCTFLDRVAQGNVYPAPDNGSTKDIGVYPNESGPVIFYLHGNGMNIKSIEESGLANKLSQYGHVIIPEYPGYGPVPGIPSQKTIVERSSMILEEVRKAFPDRRIILFGGSLGAAVAIQLANDKATDLFLMSPWTTLKDAAYASKLSWLAKGVSDKFWGANEWDSLSKAKTLNINASVVHGTVDTLVPVVQGKAVADALMTDLLTVEGKGHNDLFPHVWGPLETFIK